MSENFSGPNFGSGKVQEKHPDTKTNYGGKFEPKNNFNP
jgi:hypothetical protein